MSNRYQELVDAVPKGWNYQGIGEILPYRDSDYEFRFPTSVANRQFGIFVNGVFRGIVRTDADGVALVITALDLGDNRLELVDDTNASVFRAYATTRIWATWMAAQADAFAVIDQLNNDMRAALSLSTATARFIEDVYGRPLQQPNDAHYLLDAYRNALVEIRQGFRLYGARSAGLRQVVHALTAALPLRVPRTWRPDFIIDDQLLPTASRMTGDSTADSDLLNTTALLADTTFPTLNARSLNFVRASFVDNVSPVPSPFTNPPTPQPLTVTFDAAWVAGAAGDLVITGLDDTGVQGVDTFVVPAVAGTVRGTIGIRVAEIVDARINGLGAGAGTATIGLAESKFLSLVTARGPLVQTGASLAHTLAHVSHLAVAVPFDLLELDGGLGVSLVQSGRYHLFGNVGYFGGAGATEVRLAGVRVVTPTGATVAYADRDRLWFRIDHKNIIKAILPASPATLAAVVTAVNNAIAREEDLGADRAGGLVTIAVPGSVTEGDLVQITNALGTVVIFEADTNNTVTAGHIPFSISSGTATGIRNALRTAINTTGFYVTGLPNGSGAITLQSELGGTAGNVAIVLTLAVPGSITASGLSGGTNADAQYLTRASVVSNTLGDVLELIASTGSIGSAGAVEFDSHPVDGAIDLLGFPRRRTALNGAHAALLRALNCSTIGTNALPLFPTIVIRDSQASSVTNVAGPFAVLTFCSAVEVWFSADYNGDDVVVDGIDSTGEQTSEVLTYPGPTVIDSGQAGAGQFQTGGRAANSPGALATATVGTPNGANAEIRVYHAVSPGTAGNGNTINVTNPSPAIDQPLTVTFLAGVLTIALSTDGAGAPNATGLQIANAIEAQTGFLAAPTGTGATVWTALSVASPAATFATGVNDGVVVFLTQKKGDITLENFSSSMKSGQFLRLTSGAFAGQLRRIIHVGHGNKTYPPDEYLTLRGQTGAFGTDTIKIVLATSFGASFLNQAWDVLDASVAKGSVLYKSILSEANTIAGTLGRFQLRVRDGVEDYGLTLRVGRGRRAGGVDGVINGPLTSSGATGSFQAATYAPAPDDFRAIMRIRSSTFWAGANNGLHTAYRIDPSLIGVANAVIFLEHEDWTRGNRFNLRPTSTTNWGAFIPDTGLTWDVYDLGEDVILIGNDRASGTLTIAEPGLNNSKIASATVEDAGNMPVAREGLTEGLDELEVDVDLTFAPVAALTTESVTAGMRLFPDGWRVYNVDEANSRLDVWGYTSALHLRIQSNGGTVYGGGLVVEISVPRACSYKGFTIRIAFWIEQMLNTAAQNFRIDVSFDGGRTVSLGSNISVPLSMTDSGAAGLGGGSPTQVLRDVEVPTDATGCLIRLRHATATTNGQRIFLEKASVTATLAQSLFMGVNTIARGETQAAFGELLYVWSPDDLTSVERGHLGLPDRTTREATVADPGHIDRIVNAHGYWERVDVSEYVAGAPVNLLGVYSDTDWLNATLVNLELVPLVPGRLSYVRPSIPSLVVEALTVIAPSNATLANTSRHENIFPQAPALRDALYEVDPAVVTSDDLANEAHVSGTPVPDTGYPATRATATIGAYLGVNGAVLVTFDGPGTEGNSYTIAVNASVASDRPLRVSRTAAAILVELAARDGALVTNENRALIIAKKLDALDGFAATHLPGTGASALNIAEGPTALAGAQATPWRFLTATSVQLASLAAGDPSSVAFYPEGILATPSTTPVYNAVKRYVIEYEALLRATSAVIDLGANFANYLWLVDATVYLRTEPEVLERSRTIGLAFRADLTAALDEPSNGDQALARLTRDNGVVRSAVSNRNWSFKDAKTVQLASGEFDADSIFTLEYTAETGRFPRVASFMIEARSATTSIGVASATWQTVQVDQPVGRPITGNERFFQLRVSFTHVLDIRDVRIKSFGLRGIHLYGVGAHAPGLITVDEE